MFGSDIRTTIPYAAMANGMAAHADETDDSLPPLGSIRTHPGCSVVPSAIATAEVNQRSGMELIRAVTLGYDYCSRFAMALWSTHRAAILEQSSVAVANVFGSSAAAASLMRVNAEQARHVFSYAVSTHPGLNTFFRAHLHVEKAYVRRHALVQRHLGGADGDLGVDRCRRRICRITELFPGTPP